MKIDLINGTSFPRLKQMISIPNNTARKLFAQIFFLGIPLSEASSNTNAWSKRNIGLMHWKRQWCLSFWRNYCNKSVYFIGKSYQFCPKLLWIYKKCNGNNKTASRCASLRQVEFLRMFFNTHENKFSIFSQNIL